MNASWDFPDDPLAALRDGNPEPFEAFVENFAGRLVGFFRRRGASLEEAEDLTQDVLLKLHKAAADYRPSERFSAYLARVANNQLIDARRRRGARIQPLSIDASRGDEESALDFAGEFLDPLEPLSAEEEAQRIRVAVTGLSEAHQSVFELAIVQELSYAEVGSIPELSRGYREVPRLSPPSTPP